MIKANESVFQTTSEQLIRCNKMLDIGLEQLQDIYATLDDMSGLETEMTQIKKIALELETLDHKVHSLSKVLNVASYHYFGCERAITNNANEYLNGLKNGLRATQISIDMPYSKMINWKRG